MQDSKKVKDEYDPASSPRPEDLVAGLPRSKEPFHDDEHDGIGASLTNTHTHVKQNVVDIPMRYRLLAFSMILFFSTGSAFSEATLGPLKSTLLKQLKINNTQFSTISTASNVVNTIMPVIGGIGMDYVGGVYAAFFACILCIVGSVTAACAANTSQVGLLIGGRILLGFGSIIIETCQNKLYAHWFTGSHLGFIIATDLAWNACTYMIGRLVAVPMSQLNGWYGWALWIPSFVCMACTLIVSAYWWFERSIPREYAPNNGSDVRKVFGFKQSAFGLKNIARLPTFFWIICGTELFQNSARTVYAANLADMQEKTRGTSTLAAGYNSSLQSVVTIVLVPLVGVFFDRYGWRMAFVSLGGALYVVVFALIGLTKVNPLGPIVLSSFALSFNVIPFIGSIPILINDESLMGTAYGVWSSFIACNNVIMEVATGAIQDRTPGRTYDRVIYFLIAVKAFQVLLGPIYDYLDGRLLGHSLRRNEADRLALRKEKELNGETFPGWRVSRTSLYIFGGQFSLMILCSWIIYLCFTVGGLQR